MEMREHKPAIAEETNLVAMPSINQQHANVVALITRGTLNGLSDEQVMQVYIARCDAMGVDARTQPFDILNLRGNKILYPNARLADQLIGQRGLSVEVLSEDTTGDGLYRVRVKISDMQRSVNASAAIATKGLQGEALANAWMKCETKAVRRGVLRFCGLGSLPAADEEARRKYELRKIHAAGAEQGLDHDQIRAFAQQNYPALTSMTELDADDLAELSDALGAQMATADDEPIEVDAETGEILAAVNTEPPFQDDDPNSPIPDFLARITNATTQRELKEISAEMQDAGLAGDRQLKDAGVKRWNELEQMGRKQSLLEAQPMPDGEPGDNRYVN